MPRLSVEELNEARRRSGNLGGRPRKPTRDEAREKALDELTPRALAVLKVHLSEPDEPNPEAWRAALRVFEHAFGRPEDRVDVPPEDPLEGIDDPEEIRAMIAALRAGAPDVADIETS
jgi:hypothetical protein